MSSGRALDCSDCEEIGHARACSKRRCSSGKTVAWPSRATPLVGRTPHHIGWFNLLYGSNDWVFSPKPLNLLLLLLSKSDH